MAGVVLRAGAYEAAFRPDTAMLCTSLRYRGEEYVAWPRTITDFRHGKATAIPLMHPYANRLAGRTYDACGTHVDLHGLDLPTDDNGLPIHGNLLGAAFEVMRADETRVAARLDYGAHADKLAAFPFPHTVTVEATLDAHDGLAITTEVRPTTDTPVPISFGWHPYLRLPKGGRTRWTLRWPACARVDVDARVIPTGVRTHQAEQRGPIGSRTYDDQYALGVDRTFWASSEGRTLTLEFDERYGFAQLFVPPGRQLLAIEPMTAEIDALGRGTAPSVAPGATFRAAFGVSVSVS
jgi:galactose mutarotase-like enzyme